MTTGATKASTEGLIRQAITLEIFTLSWMTIETAVAVVAGITAGSVALLAFGIDSAIEFVAAFVVLRAFRAEQAGRGAVRREQQTLRVIGACSRRTSSRTPYTR